MGPALVILLVFLVFLVMALLRGDPSKRAAGDWEEEAPEQEPELPKTQSPQTPINVRRLASANEFPAYDPARNDESEWTQHVEPKFRKHPNYPPDWERRRALMFLRDGGRCQSKQHRGGTCGRLLCEPVQIWNFTYTEKLLVEAHVDHIRSISSGGDHHLSNLQLLCARCHSLKHPDNFKLGAMALPKLVPRGRGRKEYLRKHFYTRKAPKPPDKDVPF